MNESTPPKESDAVEQARARTQRLAHAFHSVFGHPDHRTETQKLVLDHLGTCAGDDTNSYQFGAAKDGISLIASGIHRDGAKSLLRIIERQVQIFSKIGQGKKPQPKTKR